jgi:abhydrolase domain-containing protein 17
MGNIVNVLAFQPPAHDARSREHPSTVHVSMASGITIPVVGLHPQRAEPHPVCILYCHGNAEDLGLIWPRLQRMALDLGVSVFGFDYPGYGTAGGTSTEAGCFAAAEAALRHILAEQPNARVVVFGRSLGSGPAVYLATSAHLTSVALHGLVLQSPVASGTGAFLGRVGEVLLRPVDIVRNIDRMNGVKCPVCVMHGTADGVVPWSHGKRLHAMAAVSHPPLWLRGRGHNDMPENECHAHVAGFLSALPSLSRAAQS